MRLVVAVIFTLALINFSCSKNKYDVKQYVPDSTKTQQATAVSQSDTNQQMQPAPMKSDTQTASNPKELSSSSSKYKYPDDNGIGPIKNVKLDKIDPRLVSRGEKIFNTKCVACHNLDKRVVGPPLRGITKQNTPEFILNYLLNTTEMQKKDPILKKLVDEYKILMPAQGLSKKDAMAMLDFFRSKDQEGK